MPGTTSLFGYQMRFDLAGGFPLLTTKKVSLKNIAVELIWFLKGDSNIKFLVHNNFHLWTEDAYRYYLELCNKNNTEQQFQMNFEEFSTVIKFSTEKNIPFKNSNYKLGDCGNIYPIQWRGNYSLNQPILNFNKQKTLIEQPISQSTSKYIGVIGKTSDGVEYIILDYIYEGKAKQKEKFLVQYLICGTKQFVSASNLRSRFAGKHTMRYPYAKDNCGVGCIGLVYY